MATVSEALGVALGHHQAGRLHAAEEIYRQILAAAPDEPNTLNLMGVVAYESGRCDEALQYLQRAVALDAGAAVFHNNLGNVLKKLGRLDEAVAAYRQALLCDPQNVKARYNLAIALRERGLAEEAIVHCQEILRLLPGVAQAHVQLGNSLQAAGRLPEAIESFRRAVELDPACIEARHNLGNGLRDVGNAAEAIVCYREVLRQKPELIEAHCNLGHALKDSNRLEEAVASYRRALQLAPDDARTHNCLGDALLWQGDLDAAEACFRRALQLNAKDAAAYCNLSVVLKEQGLIGESIACCRRALEIDPALQQAHGNWCYSLYFSPDHDARAICAEHRRWNARFAAPLLLQAPAHANDRSAERRLRVGYVSPDFRLHPVGRFLAPLVENHDRASFEIVAYASVRRPDALTEQYRPRFDVWRDVLPLSDERLAETIRADRIDILVDLTMHMSGSRLLAFARKPAPVQATYLAYCGTTGLGAIDYRLTDPYLDPPGDDAAAYVERSVHLPETYWCYRPAIETPAPGPLPVLRERRITFGCLNNFCKISPDALEAWRHILQTTPDSRLILHARRGGHRRRVAEFFAGGGIAEARIEFVDLMPIADFYRFHEKIDIALDPFPYGGGTTTCDALWMGVPVVSLAGRTAVGRGGLSILSNIGLPELAAGSVDAYIATAVALANDADRLAEFRRTLRGRMQMSPLMDGPRFARNVEACYRRMWCER